MRNVRTQIGSKELVTEYPMALRKLKAKPQIQWLRSKSRHTAICQIIPEISDTHIPYLSWRWTQTLCISRTRYQRHNGRLLYWYFDNIHFADSSSCTHWIIFDFWSLNVRSEEEHKAGDGHSFELTIQERGCSWEHCSPTTGLYKSKADSNKETMSYLLLPWKEETATISHQQTSTMKEKSQRNNFTPADRELPDPRMWWEVLQVNWTLSLPTRIR